ncbi:metal ABC transporter substrate-binding protein [Nocardioides sp. KR10-350]|uniref:metal ABC transporter substrate-binding protein n=1 Tax=Nocardioides cheoyonin TaxID=3156615 RepID=UPI0032B50D2B
MLKALTLPAVIAASALIASGCAAFSDDDSASDGELRVVAGLYPLQWVTQQVAGDEVEVEDLTQPGQEPHDLELSPKETADVASADLVVYEKGLQAAIDNAVDQTSTGTALDVSKVARLEPVGHNGHDDVDHRAGETTDEEAQEAQESMGDLDPHFWQDPLRMADVADAVADQLSDVDPDHASTYAANAKKVVAELKALDGEYSTGLAHCQRDTIVVSHNAFGYLGRYGLYVEPIAGLSPDAEPTPADLARLHELIKKDGITTVFGERLVSPKLADTLASDMHVTAAILDPIEGLTSETSDDDYLSLMHANLAALKKANSCQ